MAGKINYNVLLIVGGSAVALYFLKDIFKSSAEKAGERTDRVEIRQDGRTDRVEIRNETIRELFGGNDKETIERNYFIENTKTIGTTPNGDKIKVLTSPDGKKIDILPPGNYQYSAPSTTSTPIKNVIASSSTGGISSSLGVAKNDIVNLKSGGTISSNSVFASSAIKSGGTLSSSAVAPSGSLIASLMNANKLIKR